MPQLQSNKHRPGHRAHSSPAIPTMKGGLTSCVVRLCFTVLFLSGLVVAGKMLTVWLDLPMLDTQSRAAMHFALLLFILAAAIPFVPGAEIGFGLLMVLGKDAAVEVYFAMLAALLLAFTIGRLVPARFVAKLISRAESRWRLARLRSLHRWRSLTVAASMFNLVVTNRHIALGAILNMPGNSILGGGGGLAMLAGASRKFSYVGFGSTIAISVLPIPLVFLVFG